MIGVVIADDHPVVREGLRALLDAQEDIEVLGEAADGRGACAAVERHGPDVVLMDLVMPGMDGLEALERIHAARPATRVIILTSFAEDERIVAAIRAGAAGYTLKDVRPADLVEAIRRAHAGELWLHPTATAALVHAVSAAPARPAPDLTPREHEVLALLAHGASNKAIAAELVVSEKTVKTHVSSILAKLGVADRTQAALLAVRERLVDPRA